MNERQNQKQNLKLQSKRKKRGASVAAVLCFVAAIAIVCVGMFVIIVRRKHNTNELAEVALEETEGGAEE